MGRSESLAIPLYASVMLTTTSQTYQGSSEPEDKAAGKTAMKACGMFQAD